MSCMTPDEINKMEAGYDLDKLIDFHIFGETRTHLKPEGTPLPMAIHPRYSTDKLAAWCVMEEMKLSVHIEEYCPYMSGILYLDSYGWEWENTATADTLPLAICRAALLTMQARLNKTNK